MAVTEAQKQVARQRQHSAARDNSRPIRLVAGPGTGKSFVIEERVRWLLETGVAPAEIHVVSFTRASSRDLRKRIKKYCLNNGQENGERVSVTTLHSLALKVLKMKRLLQTDPVVLDQWELDNIFDEEFQVYSGYRSARCEDLRDIYEASLATNIADLPPNMLPAPPTPEEDAKFRSFHTSRTQIYRCVLPGELVRKCVDEMKAGTLNPATLLRINHLIVDEFQDLNQTDLDFVYNFIESGVDTFVAGDDDQSIYSFRFASPSGIQNFHKRYNTSTTHELKECFRCTPVVLNAALELIKSYGGDNRIPKSFASVYTASEPPIPGITHRWMFPTATAEAEAIARSCKALIEKGVNPREILILISNHNILFGALEKAFDGVVDIEPPRAASFIDSKAGRVIYGIVRLVCNADDFVAHRLMLQLPHVGAQTCNQIVEVVLEKQFDYKALFHDFFFPAADAFETLHKNALERARDICHQIAEWQKTDTLSQRVEQIAQIVERIFSEFDARNWRTEIEHLPPEMSLEELHEYLSADTDEQQESLLESVYERLGLEKPGNGFLPPRVRMMTMHGAKGLSAQVVFIPGLEEGIMPNQKQIPYPGAVQEAARLLYVSITRARAACILSFAGKRTIYGEYKDQVRSQFVPCLGGRFEQRNMEFNDDEADLITEFIASL